MLEEDTKTNYRIEYPSDPDFNSIDKLCIQGLMEQSPPPTKEEAKGIVNGLRSSQFCTLYNGDELVGLIYFKIFGDDGYIKIDFLYAAEKRKGIGSILLQDIVNFAKKHEFDEIRLEVLNTDDRAKAFYKARRFKKTGEEEKKTVVLNQMTLKLHKTK